ncbi:unnamed protein product, partial [Acanthoscelides obtectus]
RLPPNIITQIKREVASELSINLPADLRNADDEPVAPVPEANRPPAASELEFERIHLLYDGVDPMMEPRLSKLIYNNKTKPILSEINKILDSKITTDIPIENLHSLIYSGAATVLTLNKQKISTDTQIKNVSVTPAWQRRITNKIDSIRRDIGILTQNQSLNPSSSVTKKAKAILGREQRLENPTATEILDHLKQKLKAMAKKLRRYKESNTRRQHNSQFSRSERSFYKNLESEDHEPQTLKENKVPTPEATKTFWESIWGNPVIHNNTRWLFDEKRSTSSLQTMLEWEVTTDQVTKAINKTSNWKAPGQDKIQNFWYKQFKVSHQHLAKCYTHLLSNPEELPPFMTSGITYLLPKTKVSSKDPSKYRPITCLPTIYKIFTSIISEKIYSHLERNNLLDEEQKGCRKDPEGVKNN